MIRNSDNHLNTMAMVSRYKISPFMHIGEQHGDLKVPRLQPHISRAKNDFVKSELLIICWDATAQLATDYTHYVVP